MLEEILVDAKDLHMGDILNGRKIVDLEKRNGFVRIFLDDDRNFLISENIKITILRDFSRFHNGNPGV